MQAYHRIALSWQTQAKLEIEWLGGAEGAQVEPPPSFFVNSCTQETQPDNFAKLGIPAICWSEGGDSLFEPLQLRENTEYLIDATLPIAVEDAEAAWRLDKSWPLLTVGNAYESDPPRRWRVDGRLVTVTGRLNFRSYVGSAELSLPDVDPITVEVVCTKIGYFDDFRQLLDAIAEEYAMLLLEIEAPTFARFTLADATEPQIMTFLFLLRHAMDESRLPAAVEDIIASPRSALMHYERIGPTGLQREPPAGEFLHRLPEGTLTPGGPLATLFRGHTPTVLWETIKTETTDTPENRYVKAFLENLRDAAEDLSALLLRHSKVAIGRLVDAWSLRLSEWLSHPVWADVRRLTHFPSNSQILQKASSYREVLATDLRMQLGMNIPWTADRQLEADVRGDLRPVSQLYEYWCFFFLRSVLRSVCGQESHGGSLIRETHGGLGVVLRRGTESRVRFRFHDKRERTTLISLFYNRKFERTRPGSDVWSGSYSAALNPDFSILIDVAGNAGQNRLHWLHFDAKYRLDVEQWRAELTDNLESLPQLEEELSTSDEDARRMGTYKRDDLFKMHTYRDALLGSRGSYVLFPGSQDSEEIFIRYPGVEHSESGSYIPSVGAFKASPSQKTAQSLRLERFITVCIERLVRAIDYQEETGLVLPDDV